MCEMGTSPSGCPLKTAFAALQRLNMEPPCPARCALQPRFSGGNVGPNNFEMDSKSPLFASNHDTFQPALSRASLRLPKFDGLL